MVVASGDVVEDDAVRREQASEAGPAQAEGEIDVFVVRAIERVVAAQTLEGFGTIEGARPAARQRLLRRGRRRTNGRAGRGLAWSASRSGCRSHRRSRADRAGTHSNERSDRADRGVSKECESGFDPACRDLGVVIEQLDETTAGGGDSGICGGAETAVVQGAGDPDVGTGGREPFACAVGRGVVTDQDLDRDFRISGAMFVDACEATIEQVAAIICWDHD